MGWLEALLLGIVQGLTEFLPVSSSGHLMIFKELLGVDAEGFLDFTVTVHFATVLSTVIVFWSAIWKLLKGLFKFKWNEETDYVLKLVVSMIPIAIVGFCFKDAIESLFGDSLMVVGGCLVFTAALLIVTELPVFQHKKENTSTNGISWWQAFAVGLGQACAVAPGLSRSGTTIATGLLCGVRRDVMAQFSFLMVLVPIVGEQLLTVLDGIGGGMTVSVPFGSLLAGFVGAFISGLFACKAMVAMVKKAKLSWFALYCIVVAILIFIFA